VASAFFVVKFGAVALLAWRLGRAPAPGANGDATTAAPTS
jgi:hypothetical protein